jgi:DNA polymerase I-like protein with 3'-5' exonuclease and polymerase domains
VEEATAYAAEDAALALELKDILFGKLREEGRYALFRDRDAPYPRPLEMEEAGFMVDVEKLNDMSKELSRRVDSSRGGYILRVRNSILIHRNS